jgi:hypothetical protein
MTTHNPRRTRVIAGAVAALVVSGLLLSGCGGRSASSSASGGTAKVSAEGGSSNDRAFGAAAPAQAGAPGSAAHSSSSGQAEKRAAIPLAAGSDIIYTASLTVRARDVSQQETHAQEIVNATGGYVSSESSSIDPAHPARSTASLELKIPVDAYPATLNKLTTALGTQVSLQQQAQDVTETVADVSSRVTSAQAAIAQLRTLLGRATSVGDLLNIQGQISQQESALESLQAQQRALNHETAYATVSLRLTGMKVPVTRKPHHHAGGFVRGLSAGWRALRSFGTGLLAVVGALIPFAVFIAAGGYLAYRGRRWLQRRRVPPATAE